MSRNAFVLFVVLLFAIAGTAGQRLSAAPQCKECGNAAARQRKADDSTDRDKPPMTGHPKLSSGRIKGSLVAFRHGATAESILRLDWNYPRDRVGTDALTQKAAFAAINGRNRKPLLVLRACRACSQTGHPLLDAKKNNDGIRLLCRWFHLVRLPSAVAGKGHPLHSLFDAPESTNLFLSHWNGTGRIDVPPQQTRGKLVKALTRLVEEAHHKKPGRAVSKMTGLLARLDNHDEALRTLDAQLQSESLKTSPSAIKLATLGKKIAATRKLRSRTLEQVKRVSNLGLRAAPKRR